MRRALVYIGIAVVAIVVGFNGFLLLLPETRDQNFHPICASIAGNDINKPCMTKTEFVQRRDCTDDGKLPCFGVDSDGWDTDVIGFGPCKNTECRSCTSAPFQFATIEYKSDQPGLATRWQKEQVEAIVNQIRYLQHVYLVVFVHGWNHDAREKPGVEEPDRDAATAGMGELSGYLKRCLPRAIGGTQDSKQVTKQDTHLRFFKDVLAKSQWELARRGDRKRKVLGVYIGWNGGVDDCFPLSIGSRARAADRVGYSEELADDLKTITSELRKADWSNRALVMGHSLGGRVLSRFMLTESQHHNLQPLGPGVLVATVNSAIGADAFEDYMLLPKQGDLPYWINITSKDDLATGVLYPTAASLGRVLGFGRGISDHIADTRGYSTIGHHRDFQTHRLEVEYCDPKICPVPDHQERTTNWYRLDGDRKSNYRTICFKDDCSEPYHSKLFSEEAPGKPFHAISGSMWNVVTDRNVIEGDEEHTNIFSPHTAFVQTTLNRMLVELLFAN